MSSAALTPPSGLTTESGPLVGLDLVVDTIQSQLRTLDWLHYSLGKIKPQLVGGKLQPWILRKNKDGSDKGEYYAAYPNDTLVSFSALLPHDDERTVNEVFQVRTLSVIVWANLDSVSAKPVTVEMLKREVRRKLLDLECVLRIERTKDQTTGGASGIYPGFDVDGFEEQYLTDPYGGFRIETTVHYLDEC